MKNPWNVVVLIAVLSFAATNFTQAGELPLDLV